MTDDPDLERVLNVWLDGGPTSMPDRVALVVADRTARQSQRPSWHVAWRQITMNAYAKFIVGAAAVLIVVAVGFAAYTAGSNPATVGGAVPSATVAPTAAPTPAPTPGPSATATPLADPPTVEFVGSLPEGWSVRGGANWAGTINIQLAFDAGGETDGMHIELLPNRAVMAADCTLGPQPGVETTATAITDALATRPGLIAGPTTAAAVGALAGHQVDVRVDPAVGTACPDEGSGFTPLLGYFAGPDWLFIGTQPDEVDRLIALDVSDGRNVVVVIAAPNAAAFDHHIDDAMAIVAGLVFDVGP
jgi:hypothetical protein